MTRIVAGDHFKLTEYDGELRFAATEEEDGTDVTTTVIQLEDDYHRNIVDLELSYTRSNPTPTVTVKVKPYARTPYRYKPNGIPAFPDFLADVLEEIPRHGDIGVRAQMYSDALNTLRADMASNSDTAMNRYAERWFHAGQS